MAPEVIQEARCIDAAAGTSCVPRRGVERTHATHARTRLHSAVSQLCPPYSYTLAATRCSECTARGRVHVVGAVRALVRRRLTLHTSHRRLTPRPPTSGRSASPPSSWRKWGSTSLTNSFHSLKASPPSSWRKGSPRTGSCGRRCGLSSRSRCRLGPSRWREMTRDWPRVGSLQDPVRPAAHSLPAGAVGAALRDLPAVVPLQGALPRHCPDTS